MTIIGNARFTSVSKAREKLGELIQDPHPTVLLRQNEPVAVLVPIEDYNDYMALQRLARHPALFQRLQEAAKKARTTAIEKLRTLDDLERQLHNEQGRSPGSAGSR